MRFNPLLTSTTVEPPSPVQAIPTVRQYYRKWESVIGYRVFLGNARHFGWYPRNTYWPFPISTALRAMEDRLFEGLRLGPGARVIDAGCGSGKVAIHMARKGLIVEAVDVTAKHLEQARDNIAEEGLEEKIKITRADYNHMPFDDATVDGLYTIEAFVHSADPKKTAKEFLRVLKPGGRIILHEYECRSFRKLRKMMRFTRMTVSEMTSCPLLDTFYDGFFSDTLTEAGFVDIEARDLSDNVLPLPRFFFALAIVPFLVVWLLGLHYRFPNTVSAICMYWARDELVYRAVSARKPLVPAVSQDNEGACQDSPSLMEGAAVTSIDTGASAEQTISRM